MKRLMLVCVMILCLVLLCGPVLADHSVLPKKGDLDETQAMNRAVELLCADRGLAEEDVRGHWYYSTIYYDDGAGFSDGYDGSVWSVEMIAPEGDGEGNRGCFEYSLNGTTGELLDWYEWSSKDSDDLAEWLLLVPRADQMQPAEALRKAQELLQDALGCEPEVLDNWRDYELSGSSDHDGRFWYHVHLSYGGILGDDLSPFSWHVYLDANTGEVVWQSDPARFAGRWAIQSTGRDWVDWYEEQIVLYEAEWGEYGTAWTYQQYAEFEEHCHGLEWWPEPHFGLPREDECTFEQACDAAYAYLADLDSRDGMVRNWYLRDSAFYVDPDNWRHSLLHCGITENKHLWSLVFVTDDPLPDTMEIYVDPGTGQITDGPLG